MALRTRISTLRRRVVVATVGLFVAVWIGLLIQMASGNDPALGSGNGSKRAQAHRNRSIVIQTEEGPVIVQRQSKPATTAPAPVTTSQS